MQRTRPCSAVVVWMGRYIVQQGHNCWENAEPSMVVIREMPRLQRGINCHQSTSSTRWGQCGMAEDLTKMHCWLPVMTDAWNLLLGKISTPLHFPPSVPVSTGFQKLVRQTLLLSVRVNGSRRTGCQGGSSFAVLVIRMQISTPRS